MMHLVTKPDHKAVVTDWLAARLGMSATEMVHTYDYEIMACVRHKELIGAVLFIHHQGRNIEAHWAGDTGWLSRRHIKQIFAYPFEQLGCNRVTTLVPEDNEPARSVVERLGFVREGTLRQAGGEGDDLDIYGMLRSECRWLAPSARVRQGGRVGQEESARA
jgi:RimJ/RimL family protein N-acetyltransferase